MNYIFAFLFLLVASTASAQRIGTVYGPGAQSCGKYIADRRSNDQVVDYQYVGWVRGYVSGYNIWGSGKQVTKEADSESILAYLDLFCRENPLKSVVTGASALVDELASGKR